MTRELAGKRKDGDDVSDTSRALCLVDDARGRENATTIFVSWLYVVSIVLPTFLSQNCYVYRIRVFILYISISYLHSYDFVPSYFLRIVFSFQPFITGSIGRDHRVNPFSMLKNSWVPGSTTSLLLDTRLDRASGPPGR